MTPPGPTYDSKDRLTYTRPYEAVKGLRGASVARELLEHHTEVFSDEAVAYSRLRVGAAALVRAAPRGRSTRGCARAERSHGGLPMAGLPGRGWEMPCWIAVDLRSEALCWEWTVAPAPALSKHVTGSPIQGGIGLLQSEIGMWAEVQRPWEPGLPPGPWSVLAKADSVRRQTSVRSVASCS